jgi:hypothetical protein
MEEDMRTFFHNQTEKQLKIKLAKQKYSRDVSKDILDMQVFKARRDLCRTEAANTPKAFNETV